MTRAQKFFSLLLRLSLGWLFLYAGWTKITNPGWVNGLVGYLQNGKTFPQFYSWLTQPEILPLIKILNEWGLTLLGLSLILGIFVRLSSVLGAVLMLLYYFPVLDFPKVGEHSYIVDEHIVYAAALLLLASLKAGRFFGLDEWCANLPFCSKHPKLRNLLG